MTPAEHCLATAAPEGSGVYYALLFHPAAERRAAAACFAVLAELQRDSPGQDDPTPRVRRLQWWLDQLEPAALAASMHPILMELRQLAPAPGALRAILAPSIAAALADLTAGSPRNDEEWLARCHGLAAGPWQLAASHAGAHMEDAPAVATLAARCTQLDQMLDFARRTTRGRCPLPTAVLQGHGIGTTGNPVSPDDSRLHDAIRACVTDIRRDISACTTPATGAGTLPLFCGVLARLHLALCDRVLRDPRKLCTERPALLPLQKLWIAWRTRP